MIIKENREIKSESLESILDSLPPVCRPYAKREFANLKKNLMKDLQINIMNLLKKVTINIKIYSRFG
ncbi:hypothetical protein SCLARK_001125 [Spiroplasma clarkii]|uniref:hypothetical protein n=1 Tax=Spiroplasma clarkii TaxID=2139 RepID=UPI000B57842E|nr:hypothetical protein [Spiroplasma clarkii]ARU91688.1 hypothetical protein SCLARK_001125 [Spiroplasma clarkii]